MQSDLDCQQLSVRIISLQKKQNDFDNLVKHSPKEKANSNLNLNQITNPDQDPNPVQISTQNIKQALSLQSEISQDINEILDTFWPFEILTKEKLREQYDS
ncbi:MAG: hypothetical protein NTW50_03060, partial [Candidatus Berkelbacteria bacterium]|nr:hypothetical protein [Candidatus Berkelbacteria bacterium]